MNANTEPDQQRAEALRFLSIAPVDTGGGPAWPWRRRVWMAVGVAVLLLAASAAWVLRPDMARSTDSLLARLVHTFGSSAAPISAPVDAGAAQPQGHDPIQSTDEITGSGFVVAPHMTTVFSKYEGRITRVAVQLGERVAAGQILLTLDDAGARFMQEQAQAAVRVARQLHAGRVIDLAQARTNLVRIEPLAANGAIARQMLDDARVSVERAANLVAQAESGIAGAELAVRMAEEQLAELQLRAPTAGTVTRLDARVGNTVLARADSVRENQSLLTLTDMTGLVVDADVAETHIAFLRPGMRGEAVLDGFADHPFAITVQRLAPVASAEKGTITLRLSISDPPVGIRPNMAARIRISHTKDQPGATTK